VTDTGVATPGGAGGDAGPSNLRGFPHVARARRCHPAAVTAEAAHPVLTYPVLFREPDHPPRPGSLALDGTTLVLAGGVRSNSREIRLPVRNILSVHASRTPQERLSGFPVLVVERSSGGPLLIAPLGAGLLTELTDLLQTLTADAQRTERVALALPLKPGQRERARLLVDRGPPFDVDALEGTQHAVYLTDASVVFVFAGRDARGTVERLMRSPAVWRASLAWRGCAAGRPELIAIDQIPATEPLYTWPGPDPG
jgi:hypothetical protein